MGTNSTTQTKSTRAMTDANKYEQIMVLWLIVILISRSIALLRELPWVWLTGVDVVAFPVALFLAFKHREACQSQSVCGDNRYNFGSAILVAASLLLIVDFGFGDMFETRRLAAGTTTFVIAIGAIGTIWMYPYFRLEGSKQQEPHL